MKRGIATFLLIIPIIVLALTLTALHINMEKERMETSLLQMQAARQVQIDNSIKKSLKELFEYYSNKVKLSCEDTIVDGVPIPGKVTLAAGKISGVLLTDDSTWVGFIKKYYAEQGFDINFYATSTNFIPDFVDMPLTAIIPAPEIDDFEVTKLLVTCNPETLIITNGLNGQIAGFTDAKYRMISIKYTVKNTETGKYWERTLKPNLYEPKSE